MQIFSEIHKLNTYKKRYLCFLGSFVQTNRLKPTEIKTKGKLITNRNLLSMNHNLVVE